MLAKPAQYLLTQTESICVRCQHEAEIVQVAADGSEQNMHRQKVIMNPNFIFSFQMLAQRYCVYQFDNLDYDMCSF